MTGMEHAIEQAARVIYSTGRVHLIEAHTAARALHSAGLLTLAPSRVPPEPGGRIANAWQLAHVLSEQLDDAAPLNMQRRWVPFADRLWPRLTTPLREAKAEALREAAREFAEGAWHDQFLEDGVEDDVSAVQSVDRWLCKRADQIEENQ